MRRAHPLLVTAAVVALTSCALPATQPPPSPPVPATAEAPRPLPYPVVAPSAYRQALARDTRTAAGLPGPRYWQQWTDYRLTARLLPEQKRLEGSGRIVYHNRSPNGLQALHLDLLQNHHAAGAVRNEPAEITEGVQLSRVAVNGRGLAAGGREGPRYRVGGTRLTLVLERPLASNDSAVIEIDWSFTVPRAGVGGRMGWDGEDLLYLAYWYPHMAVYDDVVGWHPDQFLGISEFYHGFASYDVTVDVPGDWVVLATGRLSNAEEVLAPEVLRRLRAAEQSDTVVPVITATEFGTGATRAVPGGRLQWRFRADTVRDVAFSVTRRSFWDAARVAVGDRTGDGAVDYTRIDAVYRASAPRWRSMVRYEQHAIDFLSRYLALPYPWPHMSAVEGGGIISGGMEYPMMTLIGDYNAAGDSALYYVTAHELAHMWIPMIVSTDERRYSWLDEGSATFNENQARMEFFPGADHNRPDQESYLTLARTGAEGEIMRWSNYHYSGASYGVASYPKPASILVALRGLLGEETFLRAWRTFIGRWAYKHPYPWDFFAVVESVSGRDLGWFWRSWYYETWTLDQAIRSVTTGNGGTRIVIEDRGLVPMPVHLTVTRANGDTALLEIPVDVWLRGEREASVVVAPGTAVVRVEIDARRQFPDTDRGNNVWEIGSRAQGQ